MKVKELIGKLTAIDPQLDIVCIFESQEELGISNCSSVLEIENVESLYAMCTRIEGKPCLTFYKHESAELIAVLSVTSDF